MATSLLLSLIFTLFFASNIVQTTTNQHTKLVTTLIHRDSIQSPYHNSNETIADRLARILKSSLARFFDLHSQIVGPTGSNEFRANLLPSDIVPIFFVNISIGQPPVPQFVIMDTGSNMLWIRCVPCENCSKQIGPMLDPPRSSTYTNLSCQDYNCRYAAEGKCDASIDQCSYNQTYLGGTSSEGVLVTEEITFRTSDESIVKIRGVVLGCAHQTGNYADKRFTGVLGLGYSDISLSFQLGSRFSYCLGNVMDPDYNYNNLILGNGSKLEGYSTPLEIFGGRYYVSLEEIRVGENRLDINPDIFRRKGANKGVVIDSGSALTWLAQDAYSALHREVESLFDDLLMRDWNNRLLCFFGRMTEDLVGFPVVTFRLADGAELVLDIASMFYQATPTSFCMTVASTAYYGVGRANFSMIGLMAQQNYNVGYDLTKNKLFLQRIDCQLFDD